MSKSLIIVESPTKARTISKYLGRGYAVMASVGHVKDLPENKLGVDIQRNFTPQYVTIKGKAQVLAEIKKKAKEADKVYLAPDPDREGEAIAWHIAQEIDGKAMDGKAKGKARKVFRVLFNEITESAIKRALLSPGQIDMNLVNAQQARRVLDRIVGYQGSQLLWKKVRRGLSMGRVQSVAVKLICEREREREAFRSEEYWTITATLAGEHPPPFEAKLHSVNGQEANIRTAQEAERIVAEVRDKTFVVQAIERKEKKRNPVAPFITSRLQQEAARKLRFSPKKTMTLAQQLYEGMDIGKEGPLGLITYMRTDSTRIAREDGAAEHTPAAYVFRAAGTVIKLAGHLAVYQEGKDAELAALARKTERTTEEEDEAERQLPVLTEGERLRLVAQEGQAAPGLTPKQHFTQPPPRYNEALLIKELEEKGIGRPSTYASITSTIQERRYVERVDGRFAPTETGITVNDFLVKGFPDILDVDFTSLMEKELDEVEEGEKQWVAAVRDFYLPFSKDIEKAKHLPGPKDTVQPPTNIPCEKCGRMMEIKWGRNGKFLACPGYKEDPPCKNTQNFERLPDGTIKIVAKQEVATDEKCEKW